MSRQDIVREIQNRAGSKSTGRCAAIVIDAIDAALGCKLTRTLSAKNVGPNLIQAGFKPVSDSNDLQPGDVRIIESISGHEHDHIQIYVGRGQWMSDFKQNGEWPGVDYRKEKPNFATYRYPK